MRNMPDELRQTIARNIRACREEKYPGRGGGQKCARDFGVSPQQWSTWEGGKRTPDKMRLAQIGEFFGVTVEWLRKDRPETENPLPSGQPAGTGGASGELHAFYPHAIMIVMAEIRTLRATLSRLEDFCLSALRLGGSPMPQRSAEEAVLSSLAPDPPPLDYRAILAKRWGEE